MFVAYDGIVFDMLFLDGWQIDADMSSDGVDFLRWHHVIDVTCVINESATAAYKFPPSPGRQTEQVNRAITDEATGRLRSKLQTRRLKSGQIVGEDALKTKRKELINILSGLPGMGFLGPTTQLKSGKVVSPPSPVPPEAGVESSWGSWAGITSGITFAQDVASQVGSSYIPTGGGAVVNTTAVVSPSVLDGATRGALGVIERARESLTTGIGSLLGDAVRAGIDLGKAVGGAGGNAWWEETVRQLNEIGNAIGVTADDIFGKGRQPPERVAFPTPPVRRNLNAPPPEAGSSAGRGWTVPATFQELQLRLERPRRQLAVWLNSGPDGTPEYMLLSPYVGMTVDALKGPVCRFQHLPAIHGNVTGILKLRFETWVAPPPEIVTAEQLIVAGTGVGEETHTLHTQNFNESSRLQTITNPAALIGGGAVQVVPTLNAQIGVSALGGGAAGLIVTPQAQGMGQLTTTAVGTPPAGGRSVVGSRTFLLTPPLISNRWTMRQVPDPNTYLNTTIIEGTAHFRMDVLQALKITPDQLRLFFMHPIPFGYVRMPPEVTLLSDGASVQYQVVDVQQMINNPGGQRWGIHSVKAQQTMSYNSPIDFVRSPFAPPNLWPDFKQFGGMARKVGDGVRI